MKNTLVISKNPGWYLDPLDMEEGDDCPACKGDGYDDDGGPCLTCGGQGYN